VSDDALSVLVPVLEEIVGYPRAQIRSLFERQGAVIQEWGRASTDWITIGSGLPNGEAPELPVA
jgi:hypothetical protein